MQNSKTPMNTHTSMIKTIALWVVIALIGVMLYQLLNQPTKQITTYAFSDFMRVLDKGEVKEVTIQGNNLRGTLTNGKPFDSYTPDDPKLVERLMAKNVLITAKPKDESPWYLSALISWIPMLLLIGVWILFMRQMQSGGTKAMSFGRSKARLMTQDKIKVTFSDVAGVDEAKEELEEIIEFLKEPKRFTSLGGRIQKAYSSWGLQEPEKPCLQRRLPVRQVFPSSACRAPISLRCLSVSAHQG
jgi:cell division protease FtsH